MNAPLFGNCREGVAGALHGGDERLGIAEVEGDVNTHGHMVFVVGDKEGGKLAEFILLFAPLHIGEFHAVVTHSIVALHLFAAVVAKITCEHSAAISHWEF